MTNPIKIRLVNDIMIPLNNYPHVYEDDSMSHAVSEILHTQLESHGRKSLPRMLLVFNNNEELVGLLRRRDIFRGIEPQFLAEKPLEARKSMFDISIDPYLSELARNEWVRGVFKRLNLSYEQLVEGIREHAKRPVKEVMQPVNVTVNFDDYFIKAIYEMVDNNMSLLPVVKDGKVVGIVRTVDILYELKDILTD